MFVVRVDVVDGRQATAEQVYDLGIRDAAERLSCWFPARDEKHRAYVQRQLLDRGVHAAESDTKRDLDSGAEDHAVRYGAAADALAQYEVQVGAERDCQRNGV